MTSTPHAFDLSVEQRDNGPVVHVTGEVDMQTAPQLESQLLELARDGGLVITVDLAKTEFLDSTGLNALVVALKHVRQKGGDLVLRSPSRAVERVLELTGLSTVVKVIGD